jgi:Flp pilus assembly protein TadG
VRLAFSRLWFDQSATAAIEFAITANVFLALLLGIAGGGYTFVVKSDLEQALTKAERYALVHNESNADLTNAIAGALSTYKSTNLSISFARASSGGVNYVKASLGYTVRFGRNMPFPPITFSSTRIFPT